MRHISLSAKKQTEIDFISSDEETQPKLQFTEPQIQLAMQLQDFQTINIFLKQNPDQAQFMLNYYKNDFQIHVGNEHFLRIFTNISCQLDGKSIISEFDFQFLLENAINWSGLQLELALTVVNNVVFDTNQVVFRGFEVDKFLELVEVDCQKTLLLTFFRLAINLVQQQKVQVEQVAGLVATSLQYLNSSQTVVYYLLSFFEVLMWQKSSDFAKLYLQYFPMFIQLFQEQRFNIKNKKQFLATLDEFLFRKIKKFKKQVQNITPEISVLLFEFSQITVILPNIFDVFYQIFDFLEDSVIQNLYQLALNHINSLNAQMQVKAVDIIILCLDYGIQADELLVDKINGIQSSNSNVLAKVCEFWMCCSEKEEGILQCVDFNFLERLEQNQDWDENDLMLVREFLKIIEQQVDYEDSLE